MTFTVCYRNCFQHDRSFMNVFLREEIMNE